MFSSRHFTSTPGLLTSDPLWPTAAGLGGGAAQWPPGGATGGVCAAAERLQSGREATGPPERCGRQDHGSPELPQHLQGVVNTVKHYSMCTVDWVLRLLNGGMALILVCVRVAGLPQEDLSGALDQVREVGSRQRDLQKVLDTLQAEGCRDILTTQQR